MSYPRIDPGQAVVLVTGGGRGIGQATGAEFARRGSTVCLADIDVDAVTAAAAEIGAHPYAVDVTSRASFAEAVDAITAEFGRIDVLVNNAGIMPLGLFLDEPDHVSATTIEV